MNEEKVTVAPHYYGEGKRINYKFKNLPKYLEERVEAEVKALIHAGRDTLRNHKTDTSRIRFDCTEGYHGEAFGIMRALHLQGYGYFGSSNLNASEEAHDSNVPPKRNLRWWFEQLEEEVLKEEGYYTDQRCPYCLSRYKQDTKFCLERGWFKKD